MSDDLVTKLERFSPTNITIAHRDALLLAVGRAAAPSTRPWKFVVIVLIVLQILTLTDWYFSTRIAYPPKLPPTPTFVPDVSAYIVMRQRWEADEWSTGNWSSPNSKPTTHTLNRKLIFGEHLSP